MRDKPTNIHQLLRQALAAQMELGVSEVVLNRDRKVATGQVNTPDSEPRVVSVQEAINPQTEGMFMSQGGLDLQQEPSYHSLQEHYEAIKDCTRCRLWEGRTKFVYGVGNPDADLMFVGEGPGAEEDRLGEPFVGRAGKLLDKILAAINLDRSEVYIANMVKCRPPGNRDPQPDEMATCQPYLREQIRLIRPKLMCALGRVAGQALLNTNTPLGKLRGKFHPYDGIPMLVTYHPAALLRFPAYKRDTWEDMQKLRAKYDELRQTK